MINIYL